MHGLGRNRQPSTLNTNLDSYDNKLVSSTLVNSVANEPISPISSVFSSSAQNPPSANPFSSGNTTNVGLGVNVNHILHPSGSSSPLLYHHHPSHPYNNNALPSGSGLGLGGRAFSRPGGSSGLISHGGSTRNTGTNVNNDSHPSHPSSPWSVVTLTVLPVFNGTPLLTPIEDLNALVSAHITSSIARSPQAYHSLLSSDLQEIISSGMLTLKAKLDPLIADREGLKRNPGKFVARVGEVWAFFFGIVPYMQGIFLPLSLLSPAEPRSNSNPDRHPHTTYLYEEEPRSEPEITTDPRQLLLSGFLLHILLPILPTLLSVLEVGRYGPGPNSTSDKRSETDRTRRGRRVDPGDDHMDLSSPPLDPPDIGQGQGQGQAGRETYPAPPSQDQLGRLQHMALIISTQGKRGVFFSFNGGVASSSASAGESAAAGRAEEAWRREKRGEGGRGVGADRGMGVDMGRTGDIVRVLPPALKLYRNSTRIGQTLIVMTIRTWTRTGQAISTKKRPTGIGWKTSSVPSSGSKTGVWTPASTSSGFGNAGLSRSSQFGLISPGSSSNGPYTTMGRSTGNVPRPRRRGYFPGVALREDGRSKVGLSGRDRGRGTSRSRERDRGGRSEVGSSEEDDAGAASRVNTIDLNVIRRRTVDEFGVSTMMDRDRDRDRDQTPTITDLNRRMSRMDVSSNNNSNSNIDEETVRPRVV